MSLHDFKAFAWSKTMSIHGFAWFECILRIVKILYIDKLTACFLRIGLAKSQYCPCFAMLLQKPVSTSIMKRVFSG